MSKPPKIIAIKITDELLGPLDDAVSKEDSDRSKFVRNAIRDRIEQTLGSRVTRKKHRRPAAK